MYTKLFGQNEKICSQNEGKSISEHLKSKFSRGSMPPTPPTPLAAWALWAQVTQPSVMYISVTPLTNTATAVQNSIDNPATKQQMLRLSNKKTLNTRRLNNNKIPNAQRLKKTMNAQRLNKKTSNTHKVMVYSSQEKRTFAMISETNNSKRDLSCPVEGNRRNTHLPFFLTFFWTKSRYI